MHESSSAEPIRVGVLFSRTGTTSVVESIQADAVHLAVSEINASGGILGRPLEAVHHDPRCDPKHYHDAAHRMLDDEGIRIIFGCYMSSTRKAVLPLVEKYQGLLFYPTFYEGFEFSPNCIYSGAAPNQNIMGLAKYMMREYGRRFYLVGSNYVYPYEINRIMRDVIVQAGGKVFEERYIPLNASDADIQNVIDDLKRFPDTAVISTIVGEGVTSFYRAHRRARFDPAFMPIGSMVTGEPELVAMGAETAEGHVTSAPYFQSLSTERNRAFTQAYRRHFDLDAPLSASSEAAYLQVHLFALAAEKAGSADPARVLEALPSCTFDAPQGPVTIDGTNHHTWLWPRIGRVGASGGFEIVEEATSPVRADPYLVVPDDEGWSAEPAGS